LENTESVASWNEDDFVSMILEDIAAQSQGVLSLEEYSRSLREIRRSGMASQTLPFPPDLRGEMTRTIRIGERKS